MKRGRKQVLPILVFLSFLCGLLRLADASLMPTTLRVSPAKVVVEAADILFPTSPITVKISVSHVVGLYAWQIKLYFNATVLNLTTNEVTYPSGHVFANKDFVPVSAVVSSDEKGTYVIFGASLQGEEPSFNGSGVLCQMNLTRVAEGVSHLRFSKPSGNDTFLLDEGGKQILFAMVDGGVNSAISIEVSPRDTMVERYVNISGKIYPTMKNVNVTIHYRLADGSWGILANVTAEQDGSFAFVWRPTRAGTYEIRAIWPGDENVNPAISTTEMVDVKPIANVAPFVVAVLVVTIIALTLIYVAKFRKR